MEIQQYRWICMDDKNEKRSWISMHAHGSCACLYCIAAMCHSMALYVSWNMAPCGSGSSPTKLSCGGVAGTLREQGIWPPVHGFSKLVYWGFAARPFGRQARDRRQFKNHGFSVAGTHFLCKTMCFLLREQKGLPATVKKPWFFCCGKKWVF